MKLWLISQDVNNGYDTYDSAVVAAETKTLARLTDMGGFGWCAPQHVKVTLIGEATDGTEAGIICASFNAG